jgi:hypothetical protein
MPASHGESTLAMKLTRHEILLVAAIISALVVGGFVKRFRGTHPVPIAPAKSISKNNSPAKAVR